MIIRDADPAEFEDLAWLQIRSWRDVYRGILPDAYLDGGIEDDLLTRWATLEPKGDDLVLVADQDGIKGFVAIWCHPAPFVANLHVQPGERSRGTGALLMRAGASRLIATGHCDLHLYVAASNQRAVAFYRRLGGRFGAVAPYRERHGGDVDAMKVTWDDLAALAGA